jgi:hypothetical protein
LIAGIGVVIIIIIIIGVRRTLMVAHAAAMKPLGEELAAPVIRRSELRV